MSTCPISYLESSSTLSHMRKPNASKIQFSNKIFLFSKTNYRVSVKPFDYPPRRIAGSFLRTVIGQPPRCTVGPLSKAILRKIFLEIPFTTVFHFIFVSCTHAYHLRCPNAYGMRYANSKQIMLIYMYMHIAHIAHVIQFTTITPKISAHGLITI